MARPKTDNIDIKLRAPADLLPQLQQAAARRGVSVNAEVVARLKQSLEADQRGDDVLFTNPILRGIARSVATAMNETGRMAAFHVTGTVEGSLAWYDEAYAYSQAREAADAVLGALAPKGKPLQPKAPRSVAAAFENLGRGFASGMLEEIRTGKPLTSRTGERAASLRSDLGHLADRISDSVREKVK